jgi:hypothetical protein
VKTSKLYWFVVGMLCLILWPTVSATPGDWQLGQAQERLKAAGFDPGPIDCVFGPRTQAVLRRYQASQGIQETGALDEPTRRVLLPPERPPGGEPKTGALDEPTRRVLLLPERPPGGEYEKVMSEFSQAVLTLSVYRLIPVLLGLAFAYLGYHLICRALSIGTKEPRDSDRDRQLPERLSQWHRGISLAASVAAFVLGMGFAGFGGWMITIGLGQLGWMENDIDSVKALVPYPYDQTIIAMIKQVIVDGKSLDSDQDKILKQWLKEKERESEYARLRRKLARSKEQGNDTAVPP